MVCLPHLCLLGLCSSAEAMTCSWGNHYIGSLTLSQDLAQIRWRVLAHSLLLNLKSRGLNPSSGTCPGSERWVWGQKWGVVKRETFLRVAVMSREGAGYCLAPPFSYVWWSFLSSHFILLTNPLTPGLIPSWLRVRGVVIAPNEVAFVLVRSGWLFIQKLLGQCVREWHWNGQQFHCREVGMMPAATSGWVEVVDPWLMVLKCDSPISFIIPGPRGRTGTWNQGQDWELSLHWL